MRDRLSIHCSQRSPWWRPEASSHVHAKLRGLLPHLAGGGDKLQRLAPTSRKLRPTSTTNSRQTSNVTCVNYGIGILQAEALGPMREPATLRAINGETANFDNSSERNVKARLSSPAGWMTVGCTIRCPQEPQESTGLASA
jgi:hypothetical protein